MPIEIQEMVVQPPVSDLRQEPTTPPPVAAPGPDLDRSIAQWHRAAAVRRARLEAD